MITFDDDDEPMPTVPQLEQKLLELDDALRLTRAYRRALLAELVEARERETYTPHHPTAPHPR